MKLCGGLFARRAERARQLKLIDIIAGLPETKHASNPIQEMRVKMLRKGQARGNVRSGDAALLADMLGGALCTAAISAIQRNDLRILESEELAAESCWQMIKRNG